MTLMLHERHAHQGVDRGPSVWVRAQVGTAHRETQRVGRPLGLGLKVDSLVDVDLEISCCFAGVAHCRF